MDTDPMHYEQEPRSYHRHEFLYDIKDWWCHDCDTVTDYCEELNPGVNS